MDLEQIKILRAQLERELTAKVRAFEDATGVVVMDLPIKQPHTFHGPGSRSFVTTDVRIPQLTHTVE